MLNIVRRIPLIPSFFIIYIIFAYMIAIIMNYEVPEIFLPVFSASLIPMELIFHPWHEFLVDYNLLSDKHEVIMPSILGMILVSLAYLVIWWTVLFIIRLGMRKVGYH